MSEYTFTKDWFSWSPPIWEQIFQQMSCNRILEIGSFEGRSSTWLIENAFKEVNQDTEIVCIDTWQGGEEHDAETMSGSFDRFKHNINTALGKRSGENIKVTIIQQPSYDGLKDPSLEKKSFDFVYIDGSHVAADVITDACMSWPLVKIGGIMVFDDYEWGQPIPDTHKPKMAIDAFRSIYREKLMVLHKGYQVVIQKVMT